MISHVTFARKNFWKKKRKSSERWYSCGGEIVSHLTTYRLELLLLKVPNGSELLLKPSSAQPPPFLREPTICCQTRNHEINAFKSWQKQTVDKRLFPLWDTIFALEINTPTHWSSHICTRSKSFFIIFCVQFKIAINERLGSVSWFPDWLKALTPK